MRLFYASAMKWVRIINRRSILVLENRVFKVIHLHGPCSVRREDRLLMDLQWQEQGLPGLFSGSGMGPGFPPDAQGLPLAGPGTSRFVSELVLAATPAAARTHWPPSAAWGCRDRSGQSGSAENRHAPFASRITVGPRAGATSASLAVCGQGTGSCPRTRPCVHLHHVASGKGRNASHR